MLCSESADVGSTLILRNLHWSHARFAMEPGVLLRVRIAPGGFAPAGDPELVGSMARPIHQSHELAICFLLSREEREEEAKLRLRMRLRISDPPKYRSPPGDAANGRFARFLVSFTEMRQKSIVEGNEGVDSKYQDGREPASRYHSPFSKLPSPIYPKCPCDSSSSPPRFPTFWNEPWPSITDGFPSRWTGLYKGRDTLGEG